MIARLVDWEDSLVKVVFDRDAIARAALPSAGGYHLARLARDKLRHNVDFEIRSRYDILYKSFSSRTFSIASPRVRSYLGGVHERYGQLAKKIAGRALPAVGTLYIEHEIPIADAQAGDLYFVPGPAKEGQRAHLGWLDAMTRGACLLEMVQSTPGPRDVRGCVRKQLTLDHSGRSPLHRWLL